MADFKESGEVLSCGWPVFFMLFKCGFASYSTFFFFFWNCLRKQNYPLYVGPAQETGLCSLVAGRPALKSVGSNALKALTTTKCKKSCTKRHSRQNDRVYVFMGSSIVQILEFSGREQILYTFLKGFAASSTRQNR